MIACGYRKDFANSNIRNPTSPTTRLKIASPSKIVNKILIIRIAIRRIVKITAIVDNGSTNKKIVFLLDDEVLNPLNAEK